MFAGQIELYGPVRYCNDMICEREIQSVKPLIKVLRRAETFFKIRMTQIEQKAVLDLLCTKWMAQRNTYSDFWYREDKKHRGNMFKIYGSVAQVNESIHQNSTLVAVFVPQSDQESGIGLVYIAIGTHDQVGFHEVGHVATNLGIYSLGLWYQEIKVDPVPALQTDKLQLQKDPQLGILYLPLISDQEREKSQKFTAICENLTVRNEDGTMTLPQLRSDFYVY